MKQHTITLQGGPAGLRVPADYSRHFVWPGKGPFHPPGPGPNSSRDRISDRNDLDNQTEPQA